MEAALRMVLEFRPQAQRIQHGDERVVEEEDDEYFVDDNLLWEEESRLRQQIQNHLKLFNPNMFYEAHQHAIFIKRIICICKVHGLLQVLVHG